MTNGSRPTLCVLAALLALSVPGLASGAARVKELADVQGARDNELFGYGLVVGLNGSGDTERVLFTQQSVAGMLGRLGVRVDAAQVRARNVAAVMVTARLPAFSRPGTRIDVAVGSLGNARSLAGGLLLITPLTAADGQVYAVAQGAVQVGGYDVSAAGSSVSKNTPTSGRVPGGATVERAVTPSLDGATLLLGLRRPDFTTASRIAAAVNGAIGAGSGKALDAAAVQVTVPESFKADPVGLMAKLEALEVEVDVGARVVISERTGTVVAGERVRIRPVTIAHGGLQVSVSSQPLVSQPNPQIGREANPNARTVVERQAVTTATEEARGALALPGTATVQDLAKALSALGASARDLVSILQAMSAAGALDAELQVILMIAGADDRARLHAAAQALEALVVKQLVVASKAFTGGDSAGSGVRSDMFADALADAMVKGGGIGLAAQLERSLGAVPPPPRPLPSGILSPPSGPLRSGILSPPPGPLPSGEGEFSPSGEGVAGRVITSPFGLRHDPFDGHLTRHQGVDLRAADGEPVKAAGAGVVRRAGALGGYGEAVEIDHGNGLTTLYAHAAELLVREGDRVTQGQLIARVGHSGRATGPHLHFEVRQDGKAQDPRAILDAPTPGDSLAQPLHPPRRRGLPGEREEGPRLRANAALKIYARRSDETSESGS